MTQNPGPYGTRLTWIFAARPRRTNATSSYRYHNAVNGTKLRGWRALGFEGRHVIVGSDFEPAEAGVVGQAVRLGIGQQHQNGDSSHLPSFASDGGPQAGGDPQSVE